MADLNALIAQGAQFNLPNPVDQYSKVMQLQAAQQQMQVQRQQMQQIQEDRAGFAKLREKLADQNLTPEQYELALTQSPDPSHQKMGLEMRFRRTRLDELDTALQKARGIGAAPALAAVGAPTENVAAPVAQTFDTSAAMVQPGKAYADMRPGERIQFDINRLTNPELTKPQAVYQVGGQPVPFGDYVNANIANSAGAGERAAMAAMPNALAAQVAPAVAPVANAMASKQAQLADISNQLKVLTSPRYSDLAGVKDQITYLRDEQKRLSESAFAKPDISNFTPASVAKYGQTGNPGDLVAVGKEGTKSELARLMSERAALVASGAALTDNRVVAYDNAITKASAPSAGQPSELTRLIAERKQAETSGASPKILANYDAAINKQINFAPPMQVVMPVAVEDPNRPGSVIYVDRSEAIGKTPATAIEGLAPKEIQAREAKYPQALQAVKTLDTKTEGLAKDIETLANHPGLTGISGLIYGRTPAVTKDARAAQALYDSIVARGGFSELQNMRAASPTGGALGNVSNQEGQYLRDAWAAINRTQDTADLKANLLKAAAQARESKARVKEAFDATYDYRANRGGAPAGTASSRGVDTNNPLLK